MHSFEQYPGDSSIVKVFLEINAKRSSTTENTMFSVYSDFPVKFSHQVENVPGVA